MFVKRQNVCCESWMHEVTNVLLRMEMCPQTPYPFFEVEMLVKHKYSHSFPPYS